MRSLILRVVLLVMLGASPLPCHAAAASGLSSEAPQAAARQAELLRMEYAAMELRQDDELDAAMKLLESPQNDDISALAAHRVRELAANSTVFRSRIPALAKIVNGNSAQRSEIADALLVAERDGATDLVPEGMADVAGLERSWKLCGAFGRLGNVDFDRAWPPEQDQLAAPAYDGHVVEQFYFADGAIRPPDYFGYRGIVYAAADMTLPAARVYLVRASSAGSVAIFVDGKLVLGNDRRFVAVAEQARARVALAEGHHRLLVKMQAGSGPVSLALSPYTAIAKPSFPSPRLRKYLEAANRLAQEDPRAALVLTSGAGNRDRLAAWLWTLAFSVAGEDEEAVHSARALLAAAPDALAARLLLARNALAQEHYEEAAGHLRVLSQQRPESAEVEQLKYELARHFGLVREQRDAMEARLRLEANDSTLRDALSFYSAAMDFTRTRKLEQQLAALPAARPWEPLLERGRFHEAERALHLRIAANPLDRTARLALVRTLVLQGKDLEGQPDGARRAARELAELAPGSLLFARLATRPEAVLDSPGVGFAAAFAADPFWKPYARDGKDALRHGGAEPAETAVRVLLDDRVMRVREDGSADLYEHVVRQGLDQNGIARIAEVAVPPGAEVIELRTLKANGEALEPELTQQKPTISMPGINAGDAVDVAWVMHMRADEIKSDTSRLRFAPAEEPGELASARFTFLGSSRGGLGITPSGSWKRVSQEGELAQTFELARTLSNGPEPNTPASGESDVIAVAFAEGQGDGAASLRDQLIAATQVTPRIERIARDLMPSSGSTPRRRALAAYARVQRINSSQEDWLGGELPTADDSLAQNAGSRTAALVALLAALDLRCEVLLAEELGGEDFDHPIVRAILPEGDLYLELKSDGFAAGDLDPLVGGRPALAAARETVVAANATIPAISTESQRSTRVARIEPATHAGRMRIRFTLGALDSARARRRLMNAEPQQRQSYFESLVAEWIGDASAVEGQAGNLGDWERRVELTVTARLPEMESAGASPRWEGLLPALPAIKAYTSLPRRSAPLLIESPVELDDRLEVDLPPDSNAALPANASANESWGSYSLTSEQQAKRVVIERHVHLPAQIIPANAYLGLVDFATATSAPVGVSVAAGELTVKSDSPQRH